MVEIDIKKRSEKQGFWARHIEGWRTSGLSQREYCAKHQISFSSFGWWRNKRFKNDPKPEQGKSVGFVQAVPKQTSYSLIPLTSHMTVVLPNQTKLVLPSNLPMDDLLTLIAGLGRIS